MSVRLHKKSSANLRKMQLVDIASELIDQQGLDAVKHSALAELAGCTRALVYRYFPKKSDIFIAITEAYYEEFDQLLGVEEQQLAISMSQVDIDANHQLFSLLFDVMEKRGVAASVLLNTPALSPELKVYDSEIKRRYQQRWLTAFEPMNIVGIEAELLIANCSSIATNIYCFYLNKDITRSEAILQVQKSVGALLSGAVTLGAGARP